MTSDIVPQAEASPRAQAVGVDRPWQWLADAWDDLKAMPWIGFTYGFALMLAGWALALLLLGTGFAWAVLPSTAGFFLVAPLLGAGLYEASRRRERGEPVTLADTISGGFGRNSTQLTLMGIALLLIHLFWIRTAGLLFALFFGLGVAPPLEDLPMALLRSDNLLPFLVIGTAIGGVMATIAFAISAVSIPLLVDRPESNAFEAIATSVQVVLTNPKAMAFWAGLIVVLTALALLPFFLGLPLLLPLVGHATWHAYRDLVK